MAGDKAKELRQDQRALEQRASALKSLGKARSRLRIALALVLVTPLGFGFKFYRGPGHVWFNDYGAGLLYEVFWILVFLFFWPTKRALRRISAWVFVVTCALETLQLWHPPFLELIRSTFLGRALIGTSFVWWDFPHYVIGTALGYALGLLLLSGSSGELLGEGTG